MYSLLEAKVAVSAKDLTGLQSQVVGRVISPFDDGYDQARLAHNRIVDQHPAVIVSALSTEDVAAAVRFARGHNLSVAVQSTGHGVTLPADNAVLILTSGLKELHINPFKQTAWMGAGLRWGEVLAKTQQHGLAPLLGSSPDVGVVGYTLGGGLGWLARKYGLAANSVISFEVVTADGEIIRAAEDENAELFWGLRGGGGSFGVITAIKMRLYPVTMVYGGNLLYPAVLAHAVLRRYRAWIADAPEELTSSVVLINYPPAPQVPEFLRGKSFVMVRGCFAGAAEDGEGLLRYWRDWETPLMDDFKAMPFRDVAKISNDPTNPAPSKATGAWMHALNDEVIDTLIAYTYPHDGASPITVTEVRHAGGAVSRAGEESSAVSPRGAELVLFSVGGAFTPEAAARLDQQHASLKTVLGAALTGGLYMNFVHGQEARQSTHLGYSEPALQRLRRLKSRYDPHNLFRHSYAIQPLEQSEAKTRMLLLQNTL